MTTRDDLTTDRYFGSLALRTLLFLNAIFSLYGEGDDGNIWHSTKGIVLSYTMFSELTIAAENGTGQARQEGAPVGLYTGITHPTSPHAPSSHCPTQVQSAGTPLPTSSLQSPDTLKDDHPPSSVRSKSTLPSGLPSSGVGAPTLTQ
jgi:hypothetical protein